MEKFYEIKVYSAGFEGGNIAKVTVDGISIGIEKNKNGHLALF